MDEDADWQNYLKYINIDLKFVEEQRLNLLSKYNKMVFELNKCRDELLILKQAKLDAVTFQIQNTKLTKLNHALQEQLKEEKKINEKWLTSSKKVSQCISEQIPHQKKKVLGGEFFTKSSSKMNENENIFVPASMGILKAKAKPFPPCTHCSFNDHRPDDCRNYPGCGICGGYDHCTSGYNRIIQIRGGVVTESSLSNESSIGVKCNTCGSIIHSTTDHNEFDHFKRGTIFNANKEIVLIAPRRNDVYVLDMSSLTPNGACFFAKASESVNWLWHKRLSHLNFKNIIKLAKQNKVLGLPSLVYSKDKPCTACEKGKHHRALFKTKQNFSIRICLHLLHMDLFGPVSTKSINHEKYTLVIVDDYTRYTWIHFLRKKSQAPKIIMYFNRMVENQNDVKVKQIKTNNGTEFRNHKLESFYDEKGISQNFSSPYTPEQNGIAERKNKTLIEASRTMLNGLVLSKHFWIEAVRIALIAPNELEIPHTKDTKGLINIEGTHGQNVQNDQMITQPTDVSSGNNTKERWLRDQHIKLVYIIGDPGEGMLTRSKAAKLTAASAGECLFDNFLSKIEPKKVSKALKHPG
ncbi:retrovirus-related pol polyprotein from transposon TNT 1-94 [Tanacetum coccineum]